ncbi:hypothetical protein [Hwanghaeella sp.]|uniref:hypothetical protein n=1 Tax=Hwanghaeella sp. TaxID=2605943 RepID=UPI003CCB91EB
MMDETGKAAFAGNDSPRSAKWSWGEKPPQLYLLCALAFLATPVGLMVPERLPLLLLIIGGLALLTNPVSGLGPIKRQLYLYPCFALLVWAGVSALWAPQGSRSFFGLLPLVGLSLFGLLLITYARELRDRDKTLLGRWLVPSVWAFLALFLFDRVTGHSLTALWGSGDGAMLPGTAMLLLSFPAAGMLFHAERPIQALLLLTGAGLVQAGAGAQEIILAWIIGGIAAASAAILPRMTAVLLGTVFSAAILAAPFLAGLPGVVQHLVPGAAVMAELIWSHPFLGTGFGSLSPECAQGDPSQPGSAVLQVWLELGIFGAVILCTLVGFLASAGSKGPPATRAMKFGLLAAAFGLACVTHGAWQSEWLAVLFITGTFAAALPDRVRNR